MKIEDKILTNLSNIKITYVAEDEKRPATMMELQRAISLATEMEKSEATNNGHIPYEDGYIIIKF